MGEQQQGQQDPSQNANGHQQHVQSASNGSSPHLRAQQHQQQQHGDNILAGDGGNHQQSAAENALLHQGLHPAQVQHHWNQMGMGGLGYGMNARQQMTEQAMLQNNYILSSGMGLHHPHQFTPFVSPPLNGGPPPKKRRRIQVPDEISTDHRISPHHQPQISPHHQPQISPHHQPQISPHHQPQISPHHQPQISPHHQPQISPHHHPQISPHHQSQPAPIVGQHFIPAVPPKKQKGKEWDGLPPCSCTLTIQVGIALKAINYGPGPSFQSGKSVCTFDGSSSLIYIPTDRKLRFFVDLSNTDADPDQSATIRVHFNNKADDDKVVKELSKSSSTPRETKKQEQDGRIIDCFFKGCKGLATISIEIGDKLFKYPQQLKFVSGLQKAGEKKKNRADITNDILCLINQWRVIVKGKEAELIDKKKFSIVKSYNSVPSLQDINHHLYTQAMKYRKQLNQLNITTDDILLSQEMVDVMQQTHSQRHPNKT